MTLQLLDTFSGIGGFSLAARWLGGIETVQFVEREPYCQRVLRKHWPDVPIHDDICTFNPAPGSADIVCGGFPCTNISTAGNKQGLDGEASGLFWELMRVICMVGPRFVVLENVSALLARGMGAVLAALAQAGFDAEWRCIRASSLGAPIDREGRDRVWIVAMSHQWRCNGQGLSRQPAGELVAGSTWCRGDFVGVPGARSDLWKDEPGVGRVVDGIPTGMDRAVRRSRIHALGNAVVPQVAMVPLARVLELATADQP